MPLAAWCGTDHRKRTRFQFSGDTVEQKPNNWSDWHLTPLGWIQGTYQEGTRRYIAEPPENRVVSYRFIDYGERDNNARSLIERWIVWCQDAAELRIAQLIERFGDMPPDLQHVGRTKPQS